MVEVMERRQQVADSREVSFLYDISQAVLDCQDIKQIAGLVLHIMSREMGMLKGMISVLDRLSGEITIEEAFGLTDEERRRGTYLIGEGVTGTVVETGRPMVIPRASRSPLFLDRTGSRKDPGADDISFICVPIRAGRETIGTLSADRAFGEGYSVEEDVQLLSIIAAMISQAVQLHRARNEENQMLLAENIRLHRELQHKVRIDSIIGNSKAIRDVFDLVQKIAPAAATVLILGESGVGKELVAHAIHYRSPRAGGAFIRCNLAALPESIIESELFGHERGAFTGADRQRKGRFELAQGGTIFLDEIGELSPKLQTRLLRVLQEKEFERVGGNETIRVDVRVIAATNRDLSAMILDGRFREDLYYRLNVFPIVVPPLRERKTDILLLADHFVEKYAKADGKEVRRISTPAIEMLMSYHWPGNVRELENCIERAVILSEDGVIHGYHLPPTLQTARATRTEYHGTLQERVDSLEYEMIVESLKNSRGNVSRAAQELGLTDRVIGLRMRKHGIDWKLFRG